MAGTGTGWLANECDGRVDSMCGSVGGNWIKMIGGWV